jgi:hypothetical protein
MLNLSFRIAIPATIVFALACTSNIPIDGYGCPCATNYTCCDGQCTWDYGDGCDGADKTRPADDDQTSPDIDSPSSAKAFPIDPKIRPLTAVDAPTCLTSDADQIYFVDRKASIGGIAKVVNADADTDGGTDTSSRSRFNVQAQTIPFCGITRDGNDLYATLFGSGTIAKLSVVKTGNTLSIGEKGLTFGALVTPSSVVVDETSVYVAERDSGIIKRFDKTALAYDAGGTSGIPGTVLGQGGPQPSDLIADGANLYWIDSAGIRRMPKQGGSITTLTSHTGRSLKIADGTLFWLAGDGIWTLPLNGTSPASPVHFIEQRARENWATKRARAETDSKSKGSTSSRNNDDIDKARDPETDALYAASFFKTTAFAIHEGAIYFASQLHVYAASFRGGDAARVFVYRQVDETRSEEQQLSFAKFLAIDGAQYIWADSGALLTRPR